MEWKGEVWENNRTCERCHFPVCHLLSRSMGALEKGLLQVRLPCALCLVPGEIDHEAKKHVLCEGLDYSLEIIVDTMPSMHWVPCVRHCAKCFILGFSADGETKATQLSKWQSSYLNSHPIGFEDRLSIVPYCFFVHPVSSQGQEHTDSQQRLVK